jgi:hypothetical protein
MMGMCCSAQSITAMLLHQTTKQHWLPEQLCYITKQAKQLLATASGEEYNPSSAERLISYLRKQKVLVT